MEHLKIFFSRINVNKTIKACERARLWVEALFLYVSDKQHDSAVKVMMEREVCFNNNTFTDSIVKVRNAELLYRSLSFYFTYHVAELPRLLSICSELLDPSRVVHQFRKAGDSALQVAQDYLKSVQSMASALSLT